MMEIMLYTQGKNFIFYIYLPHKLFIRFIYFFRGIVFVGCYPGGLWSISMDMEISPIIELNSTIFKYIEFQHALNLIMCLTTLYMKWLLRLAFTLLSAVILEYKHLYWVLYSLRIVVASYLVMMVDVKSWELSYSTYLVIFITIYSMHTDI